MSLILEGAVANLAAGSYHAHRSLSASLLTHLQPWLPPERFWYYSWLNPNAPGSKPTSATHTGTAGHTLLLEPDKFHYQVLPEIKYTCREGFLGGARGGQLELLLQLQDKLLRHPWVGPRLAELYRGNAQAEYSLFGNITIPPSYRREYGLIPARCRFDLWHPDFTIDFKFVRELTSWSFNSMVRKYRYIHRAAWYEQVNTAIMGPNNQRHYTVFVEKGGAQTIWPLEFRGDDIRIAHSQNTLCLEHFVNLMETYGEGPWPGFEAGIRVSPADEPMGDVIALQPGWDRMV